MTKALLAVFLLAASAHAETARVCDAPAAAGKVRCHAHVVLGADRKPFTTAAPAGFSPADLAAAYNLPAGGGEGVTVAVIDAMDDPNAESDLAVYRAQFGLPPCTTANGCFRKVNSSGDASPLPAPDQGWSGEISLDLDAVSAICPACQILLVEADSQDGLGLAEGNVTAAGMGAAAISNSYGGPEEPAILIADSTYYDHPGVLITASTGDDGYGVSYPASSPHVLAIGGTSLVRDGSARGFSESAWADGGSGCSAYESKPAYQGSTNCDKRSVADVSAVADPNTGLAVYDTYPTGGWQIYGGTSLSSPIVAALFARVGAAGLDGSFPYAHPEAFHDVTSGSNGSCGNSLCNAQAGYDGPTGIGTPDATVIASIVAGSGGGGGTSGSCPAGSVAIGGACIPVGCSSSGLGGLAGLFACGALFAFSCGRRARLSRIRR